MMGASDMGPRKILVQPGVKSYKVGVKSYKSRTWTHMCVQHTSVSSTL